MRSTGAAAIGPASHVGVDRSPGAAEAIAVADEGSRQWLTATDSHCLGLGGATAIASWRPVRTRTRWPRRRSPDESSRCRTGRSPGAVVLVAAALPRSGRLVLRPPAVVRPAVLLGGGRGVVVGGRRGVLGRRPRGTAEDDRTGHRAGGDEVSGSERHHCSFRSGDEAPSRRNEPGPARTAACELPESKSLFGCRTAPLRLGARHESSRRSPGSRSSRRARRPHRAEPRPVRRRHARRGAPAGGGGRRIRQDPGAHPSHRPPDPRPRREPVRHPRDHLHQQGRRRDEVPGGGARRSGGREDVGVDVPLGVRAPPPPRRRPARLPPPVHDLRRGRRRPPHRLRDPRPRPRHQALPAPQRARRHLGGQERRRRRRDLHPEGRQPLRAQDRAGVRRVPEPAAPGRLDGLRRPAHQRLTAAARAPADPAALPGALPAHPRRRVPGHQPGPERARPPARRRPPQHRGGGRPGPVPPARHDGIDGRRPAAPNRDPARGRHGHWGRSDRPSRSESCQRRVASGHYTGRMYTVQTGGHTLRGTPHHVVLADTSLEPRPLRRLPHGTHRPRLPARAYQEHPGRRTWPVRAGHPRAHQSGACGPRLDTACLRQPRRGGLLRGLLCRDIRATHRALPRTGSEPHHG